jgi:carboxymethylenebutenolidase
VLAPELYWRLDDYSVDESSPDMLQRGMSLAGQTDWDSAVGDVRATLQQLRSRDEVRGGVGLIGFCYGGGLAFNVAALEEPDVLVSYYGSSLPGLMDLAPQVTAPSLHHFGTEDAFIPAEEVERIRQTVTKQPGTTFELYEGAGHAFDNHTAAMFHHAEASAAAWRNTVDFLARELPPL